MARSNNRIQLEFYNSSLTGQEAEKAEKIGMLLLASDFLGSGRVKGATQLDRISKANLTIKLARTKSGNYLAINPFSQNSLKIKLTQLPARTSISEYVNDSSSLNLDKIYRQLLKFESKEAEIQGGIGGKQISVVEKLLQAPRSDRKDFEILQPTRDISEIKEDLAVVNDLVYDEKTLDKEIEERLNIIEKALTDQAKIVEQNYKEREKYWKTEIDNKNELLAKRLKERDQRLEKDLKALEKETDKKIAANIDKFKAGVAKNIRRDEKDIEKSIAVLEKYSTASSGRDSVDKIKKELTKLSEFTKIFSEGVGFAIRQVEILEQKEEDIYTMNELDKEKLQKIAEEEKQQLKEESKRKEKERDVEMREIREERDYVTQQLNKFKDLKSEWVRGIKQNLGTQDTAMVSKRFMPVNASGNSPKEVDLRIPIYIFQYSKENETYSIAVPPVQMPNSMRKPDRGSFYGDHKTVHYPLVVPETEKMITNWFAEEAHAVDLQANISILKNILDDASGMRDIFFDNTSLMIDKLKVDKKNFKKASDRLTDVFASG